jgi:hypothetical protein
MKFKSIAFVAAGLVAAGLAWAGFLDKEVVFSEAQIQEALSRAKPVQYSYGGLATVALNEAPRILLDGNDGRARLEAGIDVELPGQPPLRVDVAGRTGLRYDDKSKAFYLEDPVTESVSSPTLRKEATPALKQAVTHLLKNYCRSRPVYVLRENGSAQEQAARWLLKSVRIEPGRVVAVLSPV